MAPTIFHTFLNFAKRPSVQETADKKEKARLKELEERFTDKTAEKEAALKAKRTRVNGKWNQFKSVFGFGEKLTKEEEIKLIQIDAGDRWKQRFKENDSDESIWTAK